MNPEPPPCESCRFSTTGYDTLLCTYGSSARPVGANRDPRGICGPGAAQWKAIDLKKGRRYEPAV